MTRTAYKTIVFLLLCLLLATSGFALYLFLKNKGELVASNIPSAQTGVGEDAESARVVDAVGKLMILPRGEEPTVATVSNLEQLAGQPFFAHAKIGQKVLIYTQAKKAILYDPTLNKIVEVAPLAIDPSQ